VAAAEDVLRLLTTNGVEIMVAEALVVLARARLAAGRPEEAERVLADAAERAERLGELLPHWEALALSGGILHRRGAAEEADEVRRRAREIVDQVASGIDDDGLRRSFLAREDVRSLGGP
jgi:Flp pilus assembly protein TadD